MTRDHAAVPPKFDRTKLDKVAIDRLLALWWEDLPTGRFGARCTCDRCQQ